MNNFGVLEIASQRRAVAPGWAYVSDSRNDALLPPGYGGAAGGIRLVDGNSADADAGASGAGGAALDANKPRKRAARSQAAPAPGNSLALFTDLTSRQEAKLRKELEVLNRDMGAPAGSGAAARDAAVPIPPRAVKAQNRYTPNVRKILASQKTFANHLDDFNAFNALHQTTQGHLNHGIANDAKNEKDAKSAKSARPHKSAASQRSLSAETDTTTTSTTTPADTPVPKDAPQGTQKNPAGSSILRPYVGPRRRAHRFDNHPLLTGEMPPVPSDDELRALVAGPPLPYPEARASLAYPTAMGGSSGHRYPARVFCDICGYWGRVKCTKCGTPVCALDCLELHRQECITRYGL